MPSYYYTKFQKNPCVGRNERCPFDNFFYTPPLIVAGYYDFTLAFCVSVCVFARPSVFSFPDNDLNNYQWIFTKLGMCIDIYEISFGIANGQISSIFDRFIYPGHVSIFIFRR